MIKNVPQRTIALRFVDTVNIRNRDVTPHSIAQGIEKKFASSILIDHADPDSEDAHFLDLHRGEFTTSARAHDWKGATPFGRIFSQLRPGKFGYWWGGR